jgi:steroid delta-isomerase-like uncharacterized protein
MSSRPQDTTPSATEAEANAALVRRIYEEGLNKGNFALLDELIDELLVDHSLFSGGKGRDSFKERFTAVRTAFPDATMTIEDGIAVGDKVASRWTLRGTHTGPFANVAPTGRPVTITGMNICRVQGGKLVEHWANFDHLGMLQQLGIMTPRGSRPASGG